MSSSWSSWVGFALDQNSRDKMEDVVDIQLFDGGGIFTVLDGHNGSLAVNFVAKNLPMNILSKIGLGVSVEDALVVGFAEVEALLCEFLIREEPVRLGCLDCGVPLLTSGVVVCVVVLVEQRIFTAHVGDCRAIMSRNNFCPFQLTIDHNTCDESERNRIGANLVSRDGYVQGLMVTRSLGNLTCNKNFEKCVGQISVPTCSEFERNLETDEFILMASDGLFEVFSNEAIVSLVRREMMRPSFSPTQVCQELVKRGIARGSCDNICVCIIMLNRR